MSGSPKTPVGKTKPAITTIPKRLTPANRPPSRAPPPAAAPVAAPLEIRHDTKGSVCGLALTSDGNFFASAVNKFVYLWSTGEQGDYKAYWEGKRKVSCLAFVPRATMVADGYVLAIGAGLGVTLVHCSATSPFRVLTQFDFKGGL
jgi:WD40 repeat protein